MHRKSDCYGTVDTLPQINPFHTIHPKHTMWTYGHLPLNNAQQKIALTLLMASYNFVYDTHSSVGKANCTTVLVAFEFVNNTVEKGRSS